MKTIIFFALIAIISSCRWAAPEPGEIIIEQYSCGARYIDTILSQELYKKCLDVVKNSKKEDMDDAIEQCEESAESIATKSKVCPDHGEICFSYFLGCKGDCLGDTYRWSPCTLCKHAVTQQEKDECRRHGYAERKKD